MATLTEEEQEFIRNNEELFNSEDLNLLTTEAQSDSVDPSTRFDPIIQEMLDQGLITLEEAERENKGSSEQVIQEPSDLSGKLSAKDFDHSKLYAGMSYDEAVAKYNELIKRDDIQPSMAATMPSILKSIVMASPPEAGFVFTDEDGTKTNVPRPEKKLFSDEATVSNAQTFGQGLLESGGDLAITSAALADKALGTNITPEVQKNRIGAETSTFVDSLAADVLPAIVSGGGAGAAALKLTANGGKVIRGLSALIAAEVPAAASTGTDEGAFLFGENALFGSDLKELGEGEANQVLEHRMNVLGDALVATGVVGAASPLVKVGYGALKMMFAPIYRVFSPKSMEAAVFRQIQDELTGIGPNATPQEIAAAQDRVVQIIEENKEVAFSLLDSTGEQDAVILDTISSVLRGEGDVAARARLEGMRKGQALNSSEYAIATERPNIALEEQLNLQQADLEQQVNLDTAADNIVGTANQRLKQPEIDLARQEAAFNQGVRDLQVDLQDTELVDDINKLESLSGFDITKGPRQLKKNLKDNITLAYRNLKAKKNDLYGKLSRGRINAEMIIEQFEKLDVDNISQAGNIIRNDSTVKALNTLVRRQSKTLKNGKVVPETDAQRIKRVRKDLVAQGYDFEKIYTMLRADLNDLAQNAYPNNPVAGKVARDFVKFIDTKLVDDLAKTNPELANAAREAKAFYKESYAPIFGSKGQLEPSVMERFALLFDSTIGRTGQGVDVAKTIQTLPTGTGDDAFREPAFQQGAERITNEVITGGPAVQNEAVNALRTVSPEAADDLAKYQGLKIMSDAGGVDMNDLAGSAARLDQAIVNTQGVLLDLNPQLANKLTELSKKMKAAGNDQKALEEAVKGADAALQEARDEVNASVAAKFFRDSKYKKFPTTTTNPYAAFAKIFNGTESVGDVQDLLRLADEQPFAGDNIRKGVELAYNKWFQEKILLASKTISGASTVSASQLGKFADETRQGFNIGREIFKDRPEVMDTLETLTNITKTFQDSKGARVAPGSNTVEKQGRLRAAKQAVDRVIYTFIGPLTRAGTRLRAGGDAIFEKLDITGAVAEITNRILTDPDEYVRLARLYNNRPDDPRTMEMLRRFVFKNVVTKSDTDGETESVFGVLAKPPVQYAKTGVEMGASVGASLADAIPYEFQQAEEALRSQIGN